MGWGATCLSADEDYLCVGVVEWDENSVGDVEFLAPETLLQVVRIPHGQLAFTHLGEARGEEAILGQEEAHLRFFARMQSASLQIIHERRIN